MNAEDRKQALIREMSKEIAALIKERDELQARLDAMAAPLVPPATQVAQEGTHAHHH